MLGELGVEVGVGDRDVPEKPELTEEYMPNPIRILVHKYGWVHLSLGLFGNAAFFVGSLMFLPSLQNWKPVGVWLFVVGAGFMLIGALGRLLVDVIEPEEGASAGFREVRREIYASSDNHVAS